MKTPKRRFLSFTNKEDRQGGGGGGGVRARFTGIKIENSRFTGIKTDFSRITHLFSVDVL